MSSTNSKMVALGAVLFSAAAAADFTALTFSDSLIDSRAEIKAKDYPAIGKSDINVKQQFENSCMAMGGLSLVLAAGLGASALAQLKMPPKE